MARRWGEHGRLLALVCALVQSVVLHAQSPELDVLRTEIMRREGVQSPSISNARVPAPAVLAPAEAAPAEAPGKAAAQQLPPLTRVDFQDLVRLSVGHELPLFGYSLFKDPVTTFAPVDQVQRW